jgi:hypothetical protein
MLHEYHVIYSVRYYPRFHITAVGLGTYYPWIWGHYCAKDWQTKFKRSYENINLVPCPDTRDLFDKRTLLFCGQWRSRLMKAIYEF